MPEVIRVMIRKKMLAKRDPALILDVFPPFTGYATQEKMNERLRNHADPEQARNAVNRGIKLGLIQKEHFRSQHSVHDLEVTPNYYLESAWNDRILAYLRAEKRK
jgi:hypothetical protein